MSDLSPERSVSSLTVGELVELVRRVMREEAGASAVPEATAFQSRTVGMVEPGEEQGPTVYVDRKGYVVFSAEEAYADFLAKQDGKLPSEVKACFINAQGLKATYDDRGYTTSRTDGSQELSPVERPRTPATPVERLRSQRSDMDRRDTAYRRLRER